MSAVKSDPAKSDQVRTRELGDTKRRIVDRLKRAESTPGELAAALGLTEAAVRQHLDALATNGLVTAATRPPAGRGRPAHVWALTDLARDLFPDHHDDLTVDLLDAVRRALGEDGLAAVIDARRGDPARVVSPGAPETGDAARARRSVGARPNRGGLPRRGGRGRRRSPRARGTSLSDLRRGRGVSEPLPVGARRVPRRPRRRCRRRTDPALARRGTGAARTR